MSTIPCAPSHHFTEASFAHFLPVPPPTSPQTKITFDDKQANQRFHERLNKMEQITSDNSKRKPCTFFDDEE